MLDEMIDNIFACDSSDQDSIYEAILNKDFGHYKLGDRFYCVRFDGHSAYFYKKDTDDPDAIYQISLAIGNRLKYTC